MDRATPSDTRSPTSGLLLSFLTFALYACSDASVKALAGHPSAYESVFIGAVIGLAALPFVRRPGERYIEVFRTRRRGPWLLRAVSVAVCSIFSVTAFTHLAMAEAFSIIFLLPALVTLLSVVFLKERVGWRRWAAVVIGFIGVLVVLRPGFRELNIGHAAAVITAVAGAVTVVMMRSTGERESRLSVYGAGLIGSLIGTFPLMLADFVWPTGPEWLLLAGYGLLAAAGNVTLILASARIPATLIAPTQYSQMLWGLLFGAVIFHTPLDWPMALGGAIIIGAGAFTFVRETVRRPKGWQEPALAKPQ